MDKPVAKGIAERARQLDIEIEDPLHIASADEWHWDAEADMVVVGLGGAGVAAALDGLERGLRVRLKTTDERCGG